MSLGHERTPCVEGVNACDCTGCDIAVLAALAVLAGGEARPGFEDGFQAAENHHPTRTSDVCGSPRRTFKVVVGNGQ